MGCRHAEGFPAQENRQTPPRADQKDDMTNQATPAELKIVCVAEQIDLIRLGEQTFLGCPYCGTKNKRGRMCCEMLAKAVKAITDGMLIAQGLDLCERINAAN